jgi:hypothetical protein
MLDEQKLLKVGATGCATAWVEELRRLPFGDNSFRDALGTLIQGLVGQPVSQAVEQIVERDPELPLVMKL